MREAAIERKLREAAAKAGGAALKLSTDGNVGIPDRLLVLPGGRVAFVELKRTTGWKYGPLQIKRRKQLQLLGFRVEMIKTGAEAVALIDDMMQDPERRNR